MAHGQIERTKHDTKTPGVTYQLERVLCGKARCKLWHGPYWYAYWKQGGRTFSKYIGKRYKPLEQKARFPQQRPER